MSSSIGLGSVPHLEFHARVGVPVVEGMFKSLARPGDNVTGVAVAVMGSQGKRREFLKEMVATLSRLAVVSVQNPAGRYLAALEDEVRIAAGRLGFTYEVFTVGAE